MSDDVTGRGVANAFYEKLLAMLAVSDDVVRAAVEKRDELALKAVTALPELGLRGLGFAGVGSIETGTQIAPLNDVDVLVTASNIRESWEEHPLQALLDIMGALNKHGYWTRASAHAIRVSFRDVRFTADVVFGCKHPDGGILIPHCPSYGAHDWIRTDPQAHARLVQRRLDEHGPKFAGQLQILKALSRAWAGTEVGATKPVSSHYLTALMLEVVRSPIDYATTTPLILERGAALAGGALLDPAGIGPNIQPKDRARTTRMMKLAARDTRLALEGENHSFAILRRLFGPAAASLHP